MPKGINLKSLLNGKLYRLITNILKSYDKKI